AGDRRTPGAVRRGRRGSSRRVRRAAGARGGQRGAHHRRPPRRGRLTGPARMSDTALTLYLADLATRLSRASHGEKGCLIDDAAAFIGCTRQTLYQRLRGVGYHSGRKLRADKGDSVVTRDEV